MAGHAQLKFVMTECSKTQIRLTGLVVFTGALAGSNCTTGYQTVEYCEYGCCYPDDDDDSSSINYYDNDYANCCIDPALAGIIAGAVVGGVVLISIIVLIVICCVMKKKGKVACGGKIFNGRKSKFCI